MPTCTPRQSLATLLLLLAGCAAEPGTTVIEQIAEPAAKPDASAAREAEALPPPSQPEASAPEADVVAVDAGHDAAPACTAAPLINAGTCGPCVRQTQMWDCNFAPSGASQPGADVSTWTCPAGFVPPQGCMTQTVGDPDTCCLDTVPCDICNLDGGPS
jgi:hypothetical protein